MHYVKLNDVGNVVSRLNSDLALRAEFPNTPNPEVLTDSELAQQNIRRLEIQQADHDPRYQQLADTPTYDTTATPATAMYEAVLRSVSAVYNEQRTRIDNTRDARIFSGSVDWTRPSDGTVIPVQLRSTHDRGNIQDLWSEAKDRVSNNDTTVIEFRAADNVTYDLTPSDMIDMAQKLRQRGTQFFQRAWAHKDALKAIHDDGSLDDQTKAQKLVNYDDTSENGGWPS